MGFAYTTLTLHRLARLLSPVPFRCLMPRNFLHHLMLGAHFRHALATRCIPQISFWFSPGLLTSRVTSWAPSIPSVRFSGKRLVGEIASITWSGSVAILSQVWIFTIPKSSEQIPYGLTDRTVNSREPYALFNNRPMDHTTTCIWWKWIASRSNPTGWICWSMRLKTKLVILPWLEGESKYFPDWIGMGWNWIDSFAIPCRFFLYYDFSLFAFRFFFVHTASTGGTNRVPIIITWSLYQPLPTKSTETLFTIFPIPSSTESLKRSNRKPILLEILLLTISVFRKLSMKQKVVLKPCHFRQPIIQLCLPILKTLTTQSEKPLWLETTPEGICWTASWTQRRRLSMVPKSISLGHAIFSGYVCSGLYSYLYKIEIF